MLWIIEVGRVGGEEFIGHTHLHWNLYIRFRRWFTFSVSKRYQSKKMELNYNMCLINLVGFIDKVCQKQVESDCSMFSFSINVWKKIFVAETGKTDTGLADDVFDVWWFLSATDGVRSPFCLSRFVWWLVFCLSFKENVYFGRIIFWKSFRVFGLVLKPSIEFIWYASYDICAVFNVCYWSLAARCFSYLFGLIPYEKIWLA